jgi:hypothetical protein
MEQCPWEATVAQLVEKLRSSLRLAIGLYPDLDESSHIINCVFKIHLNINIVILKLDGYNLIPGLYVTSVINKDKSS